MHRMIIVTIEPECYNFAGPRIAIPLSEIEIIYEDEDACCIRMRTEFETSKIIVPNETFDQIIDRIRQANNHK